MQFQEHDPINLYFKNKGLDVSYNTLNATQELILAYVNDFEQLVSKTNHQRSQHLKHFFYNSLYKIENRKKFTGFEKFKKIDKNFRIKTSSLIPKRFFTPGLVVDSKINDVKTGYKEQLTAHVKKFKNPLLYLSGGLDSELVALAMLDAGVKFTPVIFEYVDNYGNIFNSFDTEYAYKFCSSNGLIPTVKRMNIEELWESTDFAALGLELGINSPQILTHAFMIKMMEYEYSGNSHVFGGEVRFYTNHILDDGRNASLVQLIKENPASYAGESYRTTSYNAANAYCGLDFNFANGLGVVQTFSVSDDGGAFSTGPSTGNWATSSNLVQSVFEFRILTYTTLKNLPPSNLVNDIFPVGSVPTSWAAITPPSNTICAVQATLPTVFDPSEIEVIFTIELRSQGQPGFVVSSQITLEAYSYDEDPP